MQGGKSVPVGFDDVSTNTMLQCHSVLIYLVNYIPYSDDSEIRHGIDKKKSKCFSMQQGRLATVQSIPRSL